MARKITHEDFCNLVNSLVRNEYSVLSQYKGMNNKILMKHNTCDHTWELFANSFKRGARCPLCNDNLPITDESFKEKVYNLVGNEYIVLDTFTSMNKKVKIKHDVDFCGHEWNTRAGSFTNQGVRCPICSIRKSSEEYSNQLNEKHNGEYVLKSNYIGNKKKVIILHTKCNTEFEVYPNDILNEKSSCPKCSTKSKGEKKIRNILEEFKISNIEQYKIDGCININHLPFDFAIFDKENKLICLIEYDGEQHFEPVNFGGISDIEAFQNFKRTKMNDSIKNDYCLENNITLIRIPYWDKNRIQEILHHYLIEPIDDFNGSFLVS